MAFLKDVVAFLINPVNFFFLLGLLAVGFYWRKKYRWAKGALILASCFFLLTASNPLPDILIGHLEEQYAPLTNLSSLDTSKVVDILVLGSGHTADPDLPATDQLAKSALSRLTEGIRIYQMVERRRLILSGYGNESSQAQAEVLRDAATALGIASQDIETQSEPSNTAEEARYYQERFGGQGNPLILVTSAAHMPRAMYLFGQAGLKPIAAPTDFLVKEDPMEKYEFGLFSAHNFIKVQSALHEYIGMVWARANDE